MVLWSLLAILLLVLVILMVAVVLERATTGSWPSGNTFISWAQRLIGKGPDDDPKGDDRSVDAKPPDPPPSAP